MARKARATTSASSKGEDRPVLLRAWDRIYITTLFPSNIQRSRETIDFALEAANGQYQTDVCWRHCGFADARAIPRRASLAWHTLHPWTSDQAPAVALQLDAFSASSTQTTQAARRSKTLSPTTASSIRSTTTTRSATRISRTRRAAASANVTFCGVPKLEGAQRDSESADAPRRAIDEIMGRSRI